jgi:hypothetical protein
MLDAAGTVRHRDQTGAGVDSASYPIETGALSPGVRRPRREYGSPSFNTEGNNAWRHTYTPPYHSYSRIRLP